MSYHIYTTDGIILRRTPFGEANIMLHILTHDLGLILASARSARLSVSKLRPALQEYNQVTISCVKGKNGWKITNVSQKESFYFGYADFTKRVVSQVASVILKMVAGETPQKDLYEIVRSGFASLKDIKEEDLPHFEVLCVLRILSELGYIEKNSTTEIFLMEKDKWNKDLFKEVRENKQKIIEAINKALRESHL